MSQIVDQSLQKIAKGTAMIFYSTIISMLFTFGGRVLVGVGSLLNRFNENPPPEIQSTMITIPIIISNTARIIMKIGKKRRFFLYPPNKS